MGWNDDEKQVRVWKDAVMAYFKALPGIPGETDD